MLLDRSINIHAEMKISDLHSQFSSLKTVVTANQY